MSLARRSEVILDTEMQLDAPRTKPGAAPLCQGGHGRREYGMRTAVAARNREGVPHELGGEATSSMSPVNSQVLHEKDLVPREHGHSGRAADRVVVQERTSGREQVCLLRIEMAEAGSSRDLTHGWAAANGTAASSATMCTAVRSASHPACSSR